MKKEDILPLSTALDRLQEDAKKEDQPVRDLRGILKTNTGNVA
jgi:hypothetical protein